MKKVFSLLLFVAVIFYGCTARTSPVVQPTAAVQANQTPLPSATPSLTLAPTSTMAPTITVKPLSTVRPLPTLPPTATPVVETYPLKKVWVEFGQTPRGHADYEVSFSVTIPTWVLYTDGRFITYRNKTLQTKQLSESEICALLSRIKQLGFYQVQTDGSDYERDPIYVNVPPEKLGTDGAYEYLKVNGNEPKILWVYQSIKEYVAQPVKNIMNSLRDYAPANLQPYQPDRLGLYVQPGRQTYESLENVKAIPWPAGAPSLMDRNEYGALYLEGEMAARIYEMFKKPYTWLVFTEDEQEYSIIARPLLPHERRTNYGIDTKSTAPFEPPFVCK